MGLPVRQQCEHSPRNIINTRTALLGLLNVQQQPDIDVEVMYAEAADDKIWQRASPAGSRGLHRLGTLAV